MTIIIHPRDDRGFVMIPQIPEGTGYYTYGNPGSGVNQYVHPRMLTLIFAVEREWRAGCLYISGEGIRQICNRKTHQSFQGAGPSAAAYSVQ
ncbi:hypothetical protein [Duganella qianjiadongensis]|uniref:Uncharacterized protein n=1 Tax=Duganella qianjiadongensis TaxID=2692176 RepID=A0ABW9VKN9_9BURK|nr:hypothetical protein [Duganella qianjiadongensis]MYM39927.1 hypothetical protein [Duganella qianjiadongensis]